MRIILRSVATFLAEESRAGGGPMQTDFVGKFHVHRMGVGRRMNRHSRDQPASP